MKQIYITDPGQKKIQAIKIYRSTTGLGLKESKDAIDAATPDTPAVIPYSARTIGELREHAVGFVVKSEPERILSHVKFLRLFPEMITIRELLSILGPLADLESDDA